MAELMTRGSAELADVPQEQAFWVHDNGTLRNLEDLARALGTMPDATFAYHHNRDKKDFSNWVRDVVADQGLAKNLDKAKTRASAAKTVQRRIAALKK